MCAFDSHRSTVDTGCISKCVPYVLHGLQKVDRAVNLLWKVAKGSYCKESWFMDYFVEVTQLHLKVLGFTVKSKLWWKNMTNVYVNAVLGAKLATIAVSTDDFSCPYNARWFFNPILAKENKDSRIIWTISQLPCLLWVFFAYHAVSRITCSLLQQQWGCASRAWWSGPCMEYEVQENYPRVCLSLPGMIMSWEGFYVDEFGQVPFLCLSI